MYTDVVFSFFCILHFCHTCSLCRVELVVQFPARGSTQVSLCLFRGVFWLWHFLYSVGLHPVPSLHIHTFVVSQAFMAGAVSQAGDADSSRAPGLTSGLQGSGNFHRRALLLVPQRQCISSFVFYIYIFLYIFRHHVSIFYCTLCLLRIADECSIPDLRMWSMFINKSAFKWRIHLRRYLFFVLYHLWLSSHAWYID